MKAFDEDAKKERQEGLNKELDAGVIPEFKEWHNAKGKLFLAPEEPIMAGTALCFPRLIGTSLAGTEVNLLAAATDRRAFATLVGVAYNSMALGHIRVWRKHFQEQFGNSAPVFDITVTEHWLLRMFKPFVVRSLKRSVPEAFHASHIAIFDAEQNTTLSESLEITNTLPAYVYLVDRAGLIRWRGTGDPLDEEIQSLLKCAGQLQNDAEGVDGMSLPAYMSVGSANR